MRAGVSKEQRQCESYSTELGHGNLMASEKENNDYSDNGKKEKRLAHNFVQSWVGMGSHGHDP